MLTPHTVDLTDVLRDDAVLSFAVAVDGSALLLTVVAAETARLGLELKFGGVLPHFSGGSRVEYPARIIRVTPHGATSTDLVGLSARFPVPEMLPDGGWLVTDTRCNHRSETPNGFVFGAQGRLQRMIALGDGIEHVQTLSDGRIWVGYFDEGVFGNEGWDSKPWVREAAKSGLACFDAHGKLVWRYRRPPDGEYISDCFILNATDTDVWASTYSNYPLLHVAPDGNLRYWVGAPPGCQALAVHGSRLLFWDGALIPDEEVETRLVTVVDDELVDSRPTDLFLPDGRPLRQAVAVVRGRGSCLHAFTGRAWHRYDLADLSD